MSRRFANWVIDAALEYPLKFRPVLHPVTNATSTVRFVDEEPAESPRGPVIAVVHKDGQDAAGRFYRRHADEIDAWFRWNPELLFFDIDAAIEQHRDATALVQHSPNAYTRLRKICRYLDIRDPDDLGKSLDGLKGCPGMGPKTFALAQSVVEAA